MADVQEALSNAVGGRKAGLVFQGTRRFNIPVRLPDGARGNGDALQRIPIRLPAAEEMHGVPRAAYVQLGEVTSLDLSPGPNQISREDGKRRVVVTANVRGRDIGSDLPGFKVDRARAPPGHRHRAHRQVQVQFPWGAACFGQHLVLL